MPEDKTQNHVILVFFYDKIVCSLAVETFSNSVLVRKSKQTSELSSSFLYFRIPFNRNKHPFPVFIERKTFRNVKEKTHQNSNELSIKHIAQNLSLNS